MKSVEKRLVFCQIDVQEFHLRTVQRYLFYILHADCSSKDFLSLVQSYGFTEAGLDVRGLTESQVTQPFWPH